MLLLRSSHPLLYFHPPADASSLSALAIHFLLASNLLLELSTKFTWLKVYPSTGSTTATCKEGRRTFICPDPSAPSRAALIPMHLIKCLFRLQQICQLSAASGNNANWKPVHDTKENCFSAAQTQRQPHPHMGKIPLTLDGSENMWPFLSVRKTRRHALQPSKFFPMTYGPGPLLEMRPCHESFPGLSNRSYWCLTTPSRENFSLHPPA